MEKEMRDRFKNTYDDIHADDALLKRILEQKNTVPIKSGHRYANKRAITAGIASTAAAVAVFVAVGNYDFENKNDPDGVIYEVTSNESGTAAPSPKPNSETVHAAAEQEDDGKQASKGNVNTTEQKRKKTTEELIEEALEGSDLTPPTVPPRAGGSRASTSSDTYADNAAAEPKSDLDSAVKDSTTDETQNSDSVSGTSDYKAPERRSASEANAQRAEVEKTEDSDTQETVRTYSTPIRTVLHFNASSLLPMISDTAAIENEPLSGGDYHTEHWDNNRYLDYIGTDIITKAKTVGWSYSGGSESVFVVDASGVPLNDTRIFTFNGNGNAAVTVSKQSTYAEAVINTPGIEISDICGTSGAVFVESGEYSCYIVLNGASYIIRATGTEEEQFAELLTAFAE